MTANDICELTADIIGMSYPSDKKKMFFLCRMANHEIWKQGKWHGMIKEFFVNTRTDQNGNKFIVTPNGYNVLLGVNIDAKPNRINNHWFQFHRNGNGSVTKENGWNYTTAVMDMGLGAVIEQPRKRNEISLDTKDPVYLAVRSRGCESVDATLTISGENGIGDLHYSFPSTVNNPVVRSLANPLQTTVESIEPTYGIEYKLTNKFSLYENVSWSQINSIHKSVTNNPVDIYAVHDSGESYLIATLAPHQRQSSYRSYMIPKEACGDTSCVHAMFKISEPEGIEFPTQNMIVDNVTALIDMIMGMDYKYFKKDLNAGAAYILSSVKALEDSTRENMSNHQSSIQVDDTVFKIPDFYLNDNY